jgi:chloramphenicol O-acetyltransferase type B
MKYFIIKIIRLITTRLKTNSFISLSERYPMYKIGPGTYGDLEVLSWGEGASLTIGSYTSFAPGVKVFLGGEHRVDWVTTFPFNVLWNSANKFKGHPKTKGDVLIGSDVWVGTEAIILSGVKIGDGAVIGARTVVTQNIPPYAIFVGNPGRLVRYRFDQAIIDRLLNIKWWNWPDEKIQKYLPYLLSDKALQFLENCEKKENTSH